MVEICLGAFQELLEILSESQAKIYLVISHKFQSVAQAVFFKILARCNPKMIGQFDACRRMVIGKHCLIFHN